ncbi:MAG: urea amidolyase [Pseudomonadota bacterium]
MTGTLTLTRHDGLVSVQDAGRRGAMRFGVSQSGPMDHLHFALACALSGNTAAIEFGMSGLSLSVRGAVSIAVSGPGFRIAVPGRAPVEAPARLTLTDETAEIVAGRSGMWGYLSAAGLSFGEGVLGSNATNVRTGLGATDLTRPFATAPPAPPLFATGFSFDDTPIGVLPGPQTHLFDAAVRARLEEPFALTQKLDRMGYRLKGPTLTAHTHDIISDGIVEGAIQVPGNGEPIVLCADRQPTGGYPKIGVVARADLPRLTQLRPGATVRFVWIDEGEAARRRDQARAALEAAIAPRIRTEFSSEFLADRNLIGGVVSAKPSQSSVHDA